MMRFSSAPLFGIFASKRELGHFCNIFVLSVLSSFFLNTYGYIPVMRSKSRCSRRLHGRKDTWLEMFRLFAQIWKALNNDAVDVIESFPVLL